VVTDKKEIKKCSHLACYDDATWIAVEKGETNPKYKPTPGTYYYCNKHKNILSGYLKMEFKQL